MDKMTVVDTLGCLAQATRLEVFRLLVAAEPEGLAAGEIAQTLGIPHNTLSNHLAILTRADLAWGERRGRSIIYRASLATLSQALTYLAKDCCGGHPELCAPLISDLSPCCPPKEKRHA
jgi:DNA-binding transcriptional ArsR family regulator